MSFWSFGRFVAAAVLRWFPTPLRHHCMVLHAVSTLKTKAYIAASCHDVVRRFVRHRWRVIDPRVSLSSVFFLWSCHCRTLLPFTCAHDSLSLVIVTCFAMSFTLRSAATARLVLDASLLHCARAARPTLLNCAVQSFCWMRTSVFSFPFCVLPSSVFLLNARRFGEDSAAIFPSVIRFFFEDSDDSLRARARVTDFTEIGTTTMVDISVVGYVWVSAGARGHLGKTAHRVTGKYVEQAHVLLQADTKLGKDALETMKLIGAKGVDSPRVRRNEEQTAQIENSEKLTSAESTLYRS